MSSQSSGKQIAKNTTFLYIRMGVVLMVGLYTTRVVLRVLGVEDYGVYNVVGGLVSMFGVLNTSLSSGINRFYNYYIGRDDNEGITKVFNTALLIQALTLVLVLMLVETIGLWYLNNKLVIPESRSDDARVLFQCSVISLTLMLLQAPFSAAITAYERMNYFAFISIVDVVLKLIIVFLLKITPHEKLLFYGILMTVVSMVNFLLNVFYCKINFKALTIKKTKDHQLLKSMISFSGWSLLDPLSYMARGQGCNMVLNFFFGPIINAAYGIANQVAVALDSFSMNLTMAFRPQIIQSYSSNNYTKSVRLVNSMSRIMFALNTAIFLPIIFEINYLLTLWLGDSFPPAAPAFTVLILVLKLVTVLNPPLSNLMSATGNVKQIMLCSFITICSIIPLSIVVFKNGARAEYMYVIMIVLAIINQVLSTVIVSKQFDYFKIKQYCSRVILPCLLLSAIVFGSLFVIHYFFEESLLRAIICFVSSFVITFLFGFILMLEKEERKRVQEFVKVKLNLKS